MLPGLTTHRRSTNRANGMWVCVGANGIIARSTNSTTWSFTVVSGLTGLLAAVRYHDGMWIAAGQMGGAGVIVTSPDAVTWTIRTGSWPIFNALAVSPAGLWVAAGNSGGLFTSTTGTMKLFDEVYNITGGGPANGTITLSNYLYQLCFGGVPQYGYASAIAYIIFLIAALLAFIQMKVGDKE